MVVKQFGFDELESKVNFRRHNHLLSQIASAIGVSIPYASDIRRGGRRPHARHWQTLATLVNVS